MKQLISNLNQHSPIQKLGDEFILSLQIWYSQGNVNPFGGMRFLTIPLFAPAMFNNLYSDITEQIAPSDNVSGQPQVGISAYFTNIWAGYYFSDFFTGSLGTFPYSNQQASFIAGTSNFGMTFGYGDYGSYTQGGCINIVSTRMQYVNFLEWIKNEKLLLKNINFQIDSPNQNFAFNQYPVTFFDQKIDGTINSIQTTPASWVNPTTNLQQQSNGVGLVKASSNFDIPCDWIIHKGSGMALSYDLSNGQGGAPAIVGSYKLNFTFKQILK